MKQRKVSYTDEQEMYINQKALMENISFSHASRKLIKERIEMGEHYNEMVKNTTLIERLYSLLVYVKEMIEQMYSDMDLEGGTNPKKSKALKKFNDKRYKDNFNE